MSALIELDKERPLTTDGEIAFINLESARRRSWASFFRDPLRERIAETVVEHEQLTAEFVGDLAAFDRLEYLISHLVEAGAGSARTALIEAQLASMTHRFADARRLLAGLNLAREQPADVNRLLLNIDQACGANLTAVLDERRRVARKSGLIEDMVALGALLADLREFAEADHTYRQALQIYRDVSPFPFAKTCFLLGVLWGELVAEPQRAKAEGWYRQAIGCLPGYTRARVHLAEICLSNGRANEAEVVLMPAVPSGDPEVLWRLADVLVARDRYAEAETTMVNARSGFESLLERHLLAFADHGAEFYAGSGNDGAKSLQLARINVANRPTLRAFEQALNIATSAGDGNAAREVFAQAKERWGNTLPFLSSAIVGRCSKTWEESTT